MQTFYEKFFDDIRDDQLWGCSSRHSDGGSTCGGQNATEAQGSVADVTPYDGIGGWPGCPVWQVAYIVLARQAWIHEGYEVTFLDVALFIRRSLFLKSRAAGGK